MKIHIAQKLQKSNVNDVKLSVLFKNFGQSLFGTFEPIIFYHILDQRLELVLLYYGLQSFLYAAVVHDGAKIMSRIGIKKNMIYATMALVAYNIFMVIFTGFNLTLDSNTPETIVGFIILALICAIYQMLYWPGFHTDLSLYMKKEDSAKDISSFYFIGQATSIIAPLVGGIILVKIGTPILMSFVAFFTLLSIFPLLKGPDEKPTVSLSFKEFLKEVLNRKQLKYYLPFYAEGINGYIGGVFWALFVYTILQSIVDLGLLASGVALFTGIFVLTLGHLVDKHKKIGEKALKVGVTTTSLGWLLKGLPSSGFSFFIADNIQRFGSSIISIPYQKTMYKRFKTIKSFADEYVVIREMAYHIGGGIIMLLLGLIISQFNLFYAAFIVAALSSTVFLTMR